MIREIKAKIILVKNKLPDNWFGVNYLFDTYKGCELKCIYCDSRSSCYKIDNFDELKIKINTVDLLKKELASKNRNVTIGTGTVSDPYTLSEEKYKITREALKVISDYEMPFHISTKSTLILRDIDVLKEINKKYLSVSFGITTSDDILAKSLEPFASKPSDRFEAAGKLVQEGIKTSLTLMPVLPFIADDEENIKKIVKKSAHYGISYIVPYIGMSLRDAQRDYYYNKLDELFPEIKEKYIDTYGKRYNCMPLNAQKLTQILIESCYKYGIEIKMPTYSDIIIDGIM